MLFLLGLFDECGDGHGLVRFAYIDTETATDGHATTKPASETATEALFATRVTSERLGIRRRGLFRIQQRRFSDGRERRVDRRAGKTKDSTNR
jgi:hypothetical protein